MKKLLIIACLLFSMQSFSQQKLFGLTGGYNQFNMNTVDHLDHVGSKSGFHLGLTYDNRVTDHLLWSLGLTYSQKGNTSEILGFDTYGEVDGSLGEVKYCYDYLMLPIKTGVYLDRKIYTSISAGVVPAVLVNAKHVFPEIEGWANFPENDVRSRASTFDLGLSLSSEIGKRLGKNLLVVATFDYQSSLTSVSNERYFSGADIRHRGFSLGLGIKYDLLPITKGS